MFFVCRITKHPLNKNLFLVCFVCLSDRVTYMREKLRNREILLSLAHFQNKYNCWDLAGSQELYLNFAWGCGGPRAVTILSCIPQPLAKNWIQNAQLGVDPVLYGKLMEYQYCRQGLKCYVTRLATTDTCFRKLFQGRGTDQHFLVDNLLILPC